MDVLLLDWRMAILVAAVSSLLSLKSAHLPNVDTPSASRSSLVGCWDGCFDARSLAMIDEAGRKRLHSFTSVFDWRYEARSPLEYAIQSLLHELGQSDDSSPSGPFVEYWWRDAEEIRSLEAHRDVDETLCRKVQSPVSLGSDARIGTQRCPNFGHVLYVDVENVLAPTLVFEEATADQSRQRGGPPRQLKSLWSIPACSNRLLRFRGDCLHAVSYPPLEWLDVENSNKSAAPVAKFQRRAVLLFNTWETPPLYPAVGEPLVGGKEELMTMHARRPKCLQMSLWVNTPRVFPIEPTEKELVLLKVPLLGGFSRRGCEETCLVSMVEAEKALAGLASASTVHGLKLHSPADGNRVVPPSDTALHQLLILLIDSLVRV